MDTHETHNLPVEVLPSEEVMQNESAQNEAPIIDIQIESINTDASTQDITKVENVMPAPDTKSNETYRIGFAGIKFPMGEFSKGDVAALNGCVQIVAAVWVDLLVKAGMIQFVRTQRQIGRGRPSNIYNLVEAPPIEKPSKTEKGKKGKKKGC